MPANQSALAHLWNELVTQNPVLEESVREQRKFFKTASEGSKTGPRIIIGIALFFYAWLVVQAVVAHEDGTETFSYIELIAFTLVLPGSIYGAISGERERSTWEALVLTRLTPAQIVAGKLIWRMRLMLYIAGLILLPILGSRISYHPQSSITGARMWLGQLMLLSWGLMLSTFSLWVSSCTKRSVTTLAIVAISLLGVLVAIPTLYGMFMGFNGININDQPVYIFLTGMNPFLVLSSVLTDQGMYGSQNFVNFGWIEIAVWILLSGVFVTLSCFRLRRLDEPGRRGE